MYCQKNLTMSNDIDEISNKIRQVLECPVCMLLMSQSMPYLCPNGHMICENCWVQLWNNNSEPTCPVCRSSIDTFDVSASAIKLAEAIRMIKITCSHWQYGCTQLMHVYEVDSHEAECWHKPDVRCMVNMSCLWVGVLDQLFQHVHNFHHNAVVETTENFLTVNDTDTIVSNQRRVYLVRSPDGLFWVLLSRESRYRIRVGVFAVISNSNVVREFTSDKSNPDHPAMTYRISWKDADGQIRKHIRPRTVGSSLSLLDGAGGDKKSYVTIRCKITQVDIKWYFPGE